MRVPSASNLNQSYRTTAAATAATRKPAASVRDRLNTSVAPSVAKTSSAAPPNAPRPKWDLKVCILLSNKKQTLTVGKGEIGRYGRVTEEFHGKI